MTDDLKEVRRSYNTLKKMLKDPTAGPKKYTKLILPKASPRLDTRKFKIYPYKLIRIYREHRGWTQKELAEKAGIAQQGTLAAYETGRRRVTRSAWARIKQAMPEIPNSYEEVNDFYQQQLLEEEVRNKFLPKPRKSDKHNFEMKKRERIELELDDVDELSDLKNGDIRPRIWIGAKRRNDEGGPDSE